MKQAIHDAAEQFLWMRLNVNRPVFPLSGTESGLPMISDSADSAHARLRRLIGKYSNSVQNQRF